LSDHSRGTPTTRDPHGGKSRSAKAQEFVHYRGDGQVEVYVFVGIYWRTHYHDESHAHLD
jgi:hypothetical protein